MTDATSPKASSNDHIPATAVHTVLSGLCTAFVALLHKPEEFSPRRAREIYLLSLHDAREQKGLSSVENVAFCELRDRFQEMWDTFEKSQ